MRQKTTQRQRTDPFPCLLALFRSLPISNFVENFLPRSPQMALQRDALSRCTRATRVGDARPPRVRAPRRERIEQRDSDGRASGTQYSRYIVPSTVPRPAEFRASESGPRSRSAVVGRRAWRDVVR